MSDFSMIINGAINCSLRGFYYRSLKVLGSKAKAICATIGLVIFRMLLAAFIIFAVAVSGHAS